MIAPDHRGTRLNREPAECLSEESTGRFEHLVRLIGVRGVATACQHQRFGRTADLRHDGIDLPEGTVLVVFALHDQHGTLDGWQILFDVPLPKLRSEPHVGPGPEHRVGVAQVIPREPLSQACRLVRSSDPRDAFDANGLDEDVGRLEDQRANGREKRAGVNDRNRRAVAVAEKNDLL